MDRSTGLKLVGPSRGVASGTVWDWSYYFFIFFFFTSGFEKVFYDLSDYDLVCVFFFSSFYSFVADDNYIGTCISGDLNIFLFFFFIVCCIVNNDFELLDNLRCI